MKILRYLAYAAMVLVLAGGWAFLYLQSRTVDLSVASGALATLRELRELDSRRSDRLVSAHALAPDKPPAQPASSFATLHAKLEQQAFGLGRAHLGLELSALRQAFAEKAALIERHATARARLQLPTARVIPR